MTKHDGFQQLVTALNQFWQQQGCLLLPPYDMEMGAGTFHPATFFGALGPAPSRVAYVQPSRRPTDGRYANNPFRTQRYYQYQVLLKPSPANVQQLYLESLEAVGLRLREHDVRFVQDDWESPTLGAWGLGWEVWLDSLESTQFTYFQQVGGVDLDVISCELTYGLERIAMFLQGSLDLFDLRWGETTILRLGSGSSRASEVRRGTTYGDLHRAQERQGSSYNFEVSQPSMYQQLFEVHERESRRLLDAGLCLPGYEQLLKCSHYFNMLDARGAVSVSERPNFVARVRGLSKRSAELYLKQQVGAGDTGQGA